MDGRINAFTLLLYPSRQSNKELSNRRLDRLAGVRYERLLERLGLLTLIRSMIGLKAILGAGIGM